MAGWCAGSTAWGVATAASRPDPAKVAPEMLAYSNSIVFDLSVGEFSTEDVVNLSTAEMELQGEGMTIIYNEIRGSLAQVELGAVGYLHRAGGSAKPASPEKTVAAPDPAASSPGAAPSAPTTPDDPSGPEGAESRSLCHQHRGPGVTHGGTESPQSISADRLLAWARLTDGKLPPNAVAELQPKNTSVKPTTPAPAAQEPAVAPAPTETAPTPTAPSVTAAPGLKERILKLRIAGPNGIEPLTPITKDDALLTWGGRLFAVAVELPPVELEKEQVAIRFVSESAEPVMLMDARSGATALCGALHYGATTAGAVLTPQDNSPITIADAKGGHGELPGLTLNLKSGIGQAAGGKGFVKRRDPTKATETGKSGDQLLEWSDQADFVFAMSSGDAASGKAGTGLQSIREASFTGDARGVSGEAEVTGIS